MEDEDEDPKALQRHCRLLKQAYDTKSKTTSMDTDEKRIYRTTHIFHSKTDCS